MTERYTTPNNIGFFITLITFSVTWVSTGDAFAAEVVVILKRACLASPNTSAFSPALR